jgi:hypothetical protein
VCIRARKNTKYQNMIGDELPDSLFIHAAFRRSELKSQEIAWNIKLTNQNENFPKKKYV